MKCLLVTQYLGQQLHIMKASGVPITLLDDIVQLITASGTPDECRAKVAEYVAAGCTCPILYSVGPDVRLMIDTFADGTS